MLSKNEISGMSVSVKNVSRYYGNFRALYNLSFSIPEGSIAALLGLNGAGKTTTLRILSGLLAATTGEVKIAGTNIGEDFYSYKKNIGFLSEDFGLYETMRVGEFLRFLFRLRAGQKKDENQFINKALEKTDLINKKNAVISTLSAGYKKRVGLAQAIVHNPSVLILDEPVADLDPVQIVEVRNLMLELKKSHTILLSSHYLSEVARTADLYLFIHNGELKRQEVKGSPAVENLETTFIETVRG